jgi:membrane-associated phospholipid phosphatase
MTQQFDDVVDQRLEVRRREMAVALRWSAILLLGFIAISLDVIYQGLLSDIDKYFAELKRPAFSPTTQFILMRIDNLGLRALSAGFLLIAAILIGRRFKSWRPLNLSILSLLFLNLFVGAAKLGMGRCKSWQNFDPCLFTGGTAFPSGHASNAIVTWGLLAYIIFRYTHRAPFEGLKLYWLVGLVTLAVSVVSLIRNTHWFTDLLGGMFIGGAILIFVVAIDRFIPSQKQPS